MTSPSPQAIHRFRPLNLYRVKLFALYRDNMDPGGITREEIGEIIPEYLTNIIQENQRRGNFFKF